MGYLKRPSKQPNVRPKPDGTCKKHPKHKQSPGVCSLCLSLKLSQLSSSSSFPTLDLSSSVSSSSLSSSSCSSYASPIRYNNSNGNKQASSLSFFFNPKNVLTKSRSLVFISRNKENDRSFLSKLLRPKKKTIEQGLLHSRTMRELRVNINNCKLDLF